ncbi:MAG: zinc ribbon domain-containing protein [Spartobacteria bacterium]
MNKLICPDCQHENEVERIYCHNCGARLDRSSLVKGKPEDAPVEEKTRQHLKKMFSPTRGVGKRIAVQLAQVFLGAICLAAVIVMLLPPDLPPAPKNYDFAPMINMDMVSALSSRQPATLVYNEEQVNSYLAAALRRKDSPAQQGYLPLKRIFAQFQEGTCTVHLERHLFGLSIFNGGTYRLALANGKISAENKGGYIGRMPIHPALMRYADFLFSKAWECLARERNSVSRLAGVEFHPQTVSLIVAR